MTPQESKLLEFLNAAGDIGRFAIQVGLGLPPADQEAHDTALREDLYRLIDVAPVIDAPNVLSRIFQLTPMGWHRRAILRGERPN